MILTIALFFFGIVLQQSDVDCIECYTCTDVSALAMCNQISTCPLYSSCYIDVVVTGSSSRYNLGCKASSSCPITPTNSSFQLNIGNIVGRSVSGRTNCSECCHISNCNRQLCQEYDPTCVDTADYDCAILGSTVDICSDTKHAKNNCRNYCGYCSRADGGWASWSSWSQCDVSCGNGSKSRTRACADPVPAEGGDNCAGLNQDKQTCRMAQCPVHGDWSHWSPWGGCSSTCDIGMQRRDRSCSNPYPSRNGDHCFGESRDDRLCFPGACADGMWSTWGSWSGCSHTCGSGFHTRSRSCNNPTPSVTGRDCVGDPVQTTACNTQKCTVKVSAFTATTPSGLKTLIKFTHAVFNQGNDYSTSSGRFTCEYPGLYFFMLSLTKLRSTNDGLNDLVGCYIQRNGQNQVRAYIDPTDTNDVDIGSYETSASLTIHLNKGDYVTIGGCRVGADHMESWSLFSGFLFVPDS